MKNNLWLRILVGIISMLLAGAIEGALIMIMLA
jgi:hypothetical protein